jgi:hypothetical protein
MPFLNAGTAPLLGDQVAAGLEVKGSGDLRQVLQSRQMDALEVFVNQDFGPTQQGREFARFERRIGQELVEMTGELAVPFGHRR